MKIVARIIFGYRLEGESSKMRFARSCVAALLVLQTAITFGARSRASVTAPVDATPRPREIKTERKESAKSSMTREPSPAPPEMTSSSIVINLSPTSAPATVSPVSYRTSTSDEIRAEIAKLQAVLDGLSTSSAHRKDTESLIRTLQLRLEQGVRTDDMIEEIATQTSDLRGLPILRPVRFRIMDGQELRALLSKKLGEQMPGDDMPNLEFVLKLLGALPERGDLRKMLVGLFSEQVAGLYDDDTQILYVMKQFDLGRSLARIILSHEICHALQDQNFPFKNLPLKERGNDDQTLAISALLEGDATILMQDYAALRFTAADVLQLSDIFTIDQAAMNKAPYFIRQQLIFPYLAGANFILQISYKNPALRDQAFVHYPLSTEQILHPEKYMTGDRDEPTSVALPDFSTNIGLGFKRSTQNVMGEFQIRTLFETWREWNVAPRIAQGWDGDQYQLYRRDNEYVFLWASSWDSEEDASEFFDGVSDLMRDKRFKEDYGGKPYGGEAFIRTLTIDGNSTETVSAHLRFRRSEHKAIVEITNSKAAFEKLDTLDNNIFDGMAKRK